MSTDVTIDRLTGHLMGGPDTAAAHTWLEATLREVAGALPHELTRARLPDGLWFLPRLDLVLRVPSRYGIAGAWSRAIVDALTDALRHRAEWVHYPNDLEMLADAVAAAAHGSRDREWVWQQAGLLPAGATTPRAQVVAVLSARPHLTVPALTAAAGQVGVAALDRALGVSGWLDVAQVAGLPPQMEDAGEAVAPEAGRGTGPAGLLPRSRLGRLLLDSRLRPVPETVAVWAALVVADAEPALVDSPRGAPARRTVADALRRALPGCPPPAATAAPPPVPRATDDQEPGGASDELVPGRRATVTPVPGTVAADASPALLPDPPTEPVHHPEPTVSREAMRVLPPDGVPHGTEPPPSGPPAAGREEPSETAGPDDVDEPQPVGAPTPWAGLPFLLHCAAAAGMPGRVLDHPVLGERGVRWAVHHAARALVPTEADDPALLALSGLDQEGAGGLLRESPPDRAERAALLRLAHAWRRRAAARLRAAGGPGGDRQLLVELVRRPGRVQAAPGWIVVVLSSDSVDVAVRRAGLDLDLGWVPWLGTVVEFRYV